MNLNLSDTFHLDSFKPLLGGEYAEKEWKNHSVKPLNTFLHTNSYKDFINKEILFLFGRRGTGKTTMMRMLAYEISIGIYSDSYSYAWVIPSEDAYKDIIKFLESGVTAISEYNRLINTLIDKWVWILNVSAMFITLKSEIKIQPNDQDIKTIINYLGSQEMFDEENQEFRMTPFKKIINEIKVEFEKINNNFAKYGAAIMEIAEKLLNPDYTKAKKALTHFLSSHNKTCLVMVDSIDLFQVKEKAPQALITALIEATLKFYHTEDKEHIVVKVAFPSEIYPHIQAINAEKIMCNILFINWRYHDLVSLLAVRYLKMIKPTAHNDEYSQLSIFKNAIMFLYKYLPKKTQSHTGVEFDTLAYVIRHTQKKPRELIILMNIVLTLAEKVGINILFDVIPSELIRRGLHVRTDLVAEGILNFYEKIYPNAIKLVLGTLQGSCNLLTCSELDKRLKNISSLRSQENFSKSEVKDLLIESGVIGVVYNCDILPNQNRILEAVFEYQKKGRLSITSEAECVIHPLFYQYLETKVSKDNFIYPKPFDDFDEQEIVSEIKEQYKKINNL